MKMKMWIIKFALFGLNLVLLSVVIRKSMEFSLVPSSPYLQTRFGGSSADCSCKWGCGNTDVPEETASIPGPSDYNATRLIVYNVIAKCGSTTVRNHMRSMAKINGFTAVALPAEEENFAELLVKMYRKSSRPILHAYHHPFVDFERIGYPQPPHVQVMRDPVEQAISVYHYYMDLKKITPAEWNRTIEECIASLEHCPCLKSVLNVTSLHHFCEGCGEPNGFLKVRSSTPGAVQRAKQSIVRAHSVVGITEELQGFFDVLEYVHPDYFKGTAKAYRERQVKTLNRSKNRKEWPDWAKEELRNNLKADIEVYEFIKQRFYAHWSQSKAQI